MNAAQAAVSVGLPATTPVEILQALNTYVNASAVKKGNTQQSKEQQEIAKQQINAAKAALMSYMESNGIAYLDLNGKFLVISDTLTPLAYSDEFVKQAFFHFMNTNRQVGVPLEKMACDFVAFCGEHRKKNGKRNKTLKEAQTKPTGAVFGNALFGPPMQGV